MKMFFQEQPFPKKINQINNRLKRINNYVFLFKYDQNYETGKVYKKAEIEIAAYSL